MVKVALGKFACSGIESQLGDDIPAGVRAALFYYAGKLEAGRRLAPFPRFLDDRGAPEVGLSFDLAVDAETESLLEREAVRQRTTLNQLVAHTVMVYLAELDFLGAATPPREIPPVF